MKFGILTFTLLLIFSLRLSAQNTYSVRGAVGDTTEKIKLKNASVSVLQAKDSILVNYTRVTADGTFTLNNLEKGKFILLVTYPGYADYVEQFSLDSANKTHVFGALSLVLKTKLLADVIIKGTRSAIKIKGDTTEYNAAAFKIQPNSKVEDLLKQLPGIQVDKDGKITAEGQTVNKVLVDGEEFFGDDPTLVTKNIRADMVDKVQLYDKKSDQAAFTGIDDGQRTKTINIKLKEDKKNGYFGKVDAGVGTDGYYEGQLLFNKFKAKQKFSAYFTSGNNGKTGLGWQDNQKYGTSDNMQFGDNGEIYIMGGSGDGLDSFSGQYNGQGTPTAQNGGVHYDNKWNNDKESINVNYKIGSLDVDGFNNTQTQNNTKTNVFNTTSNQTFNNSMFRQKLDYTFQIKPDTTSNLRISMDGTLKNTHTKNNNLTSITNGGDSLLNNEYRNVDNKDDSKIFDASALYTKKFKKTGRTLSLNASFSENETNSNGYLKSNTNYYDGTGQIDSTKIIDQYKTADVTTSVVKTNFTYSEPLSKTFSVLLNYGLEVDNGSSNLNTYNPAPEGGYTDKVGDLSSDYKLNGVTNQAGAMFNYKKSKMTFNFGTKISNQNFNQTDEVSGGILKRNFIIWAPQANFSYRFSQQQGVNVFYQGTANVPNMQQIQPVANNSNPQNIVIGNPDLTPSFTNRFFFNYNSYKVLSGQSVFLYGNYSFTSNPIVNNVVTSGTGNSVTQYVNLSDKKQSNVNLNAYFDRKLAKADINIGLNLGVSGSNSYNFSNSAIDLTKSFTYSGQLRVSKYKEKKYDLWLNLGPNYTVSGSSLTPDINNNGPGFTGNSGFTLYLPLKFQISSDASYEWRGKTETFNTDFNRTLINAAIAKTFLKEDNLKLSISGNDLLNQNVGFSRTINANYITQNSYTTIKRYFMISLVYDFNKMGGVTKK